MENGNVVNSWEDQNDPLIAHFRASELDPEPNPDEQPELARQYGEKLYRIAKVFYDKADLVVAEKYFLKSLNFIVLPRDIFAALKINGFLIRIYSERQEQNLAEKHIDDSENMINEYSQTAGSLTSEYFYYLGANQSYRGLFKESLENFKLAMQKSEEENEPELKSKVLYSIAKSYSHLGEYEAALSCLTQLKDLLEILRKDFLKGSMHMLTGHIKTELSLYKEALLEYDEAMKALRTKNCWNLYCYILVGIGRISKKVGEYRKSMDFFGLAKKSVNENQFKRLANVIEEEINDVQDSSVDIYLDRHNRVIYEKTLGPIDFKHRFVLLEILFLLARNPGTPYDKDQLARRVWKDEYNPLIHDKLIYTSISRLRKLIEPKGGKLKYILRGKDGYKFNPRAKARFYQEADAHSANNIGHVEISSPV